MTKRLIRNVVLGTETVDVLIAGNRFERIGPGLRDPAAEVLDARGAQAILPPFYNAHTHAAMTLLRGYADDLSLFEWLHRHIWPVEARMGPGDIALGARLACVEMIRSGTVFFNDMYWHPQRAAEAASAMGLRCCAGPILLDAFDPSRTARQREQAEAFLAEPSAWPARMIPAINLHSVYGVRPETLAWAAERARESGVRIHLHLSETEQEQRECFERFGLSPAAAMDRAGLLTPRTLAAHGVWLDDRDRALLAERGVTLVHLPVSNMKLGSGAFDYAAARRAGLKVALGTDGCSSNNSLDMIQEMKTAALLAKLVSRDPAMLPAPEAYAMASRAGAEAFGLEGGRIEPGRPADALLVNLRHARLTPGHRLVSDMVYSAESSVISSVLCDGEFLMRDGVVAGEEEILGEAREAARRLCRGPAG